MYCFSEKGNEKIAGKHENANWVNKISLKIGPWECSCFRKEVQSMSVHRLKGKYQIICVVLGQNLGGSEVILNLSFCRNFNLWAEIWRVCSNNFGRMTERVMHKCLGSHIWLLDDERSKLYIHKINYISSTLRLYVIFLKLEGISPSWWGHFEIIPGFSIQGGSAVCMLDCLYLQIHL